MKTLFLLLIRFYQKFLSLDTGKVGPFWVFLGISRYSRSCRYFPTCSEYAYQAIKKHGILSGIRLGLARIVRCRPGSAGGYDPC